MMLFGHLWIRRTHRKLRIAWLGVNRDYTLMLSVKTRED